MLKNQRIKVLKVYLVIGILLINFFTIILKTSSSFISEFVTETLFEKLSKKQLIFFEYRESLKKKNWMK